MKDNAKYWHKAITVALQCVGLLLVGAAASAADLFTPMVEIATANPGAPLSAIRCNAVNVSSAPRNGTLSIIQADGTPLSTTSFNELQPGGGTGDAVTVFSNPTPITLAYCKITVEGTKCTIRGSLSRTDADGNAVVVVEAQ
jgi:hypothetical protein